MKTPWLPSTAPIWAARRTIQGSRDYGTGTPPLEPDWAAIDEDLTIYGTAWIKITSAGGKRVDPVRVNLDLFPPRKPGLFSRMKRWFFGEP